MQMQLCDWLLLVGDIPKIRRARDEIGTRSRQEISRVEMLCDDDDDEWCVSMCDVCECRRHWLASSSSDGDADNQRRRVMIADSHVYEY